MRDIRDGSERIKEGWERKEKREERGEKETKKVMEITVFKDQNVLRDQVGHFWEVLDLVDISPNLRVVLWNLPFYF